MDKTETIFVSINQENAETMGSVMACLHIQYVSGCHFDTTLIIMHETPKVSAEGHGHP